MLPFPPYHFSAGFFSGIFGGILMVFTGPSGESFHPRERSRFAKLFPGDARVKMLFGGHPVGLFVGRLDRL
jgi:hypothetical protein